MSDIEQRIRERAYRMWLDEGRPQGRELDHWDKATELVAIEDGQRSTLRRIEHNVGPLGEPIEPIEAVRNAGEFPTLTDQGEGQYSASHPESRAVGAEG